MKTFFVFFLSLLCIPTYANSIKIGYIDTSEVINNISYYQKSINEISKEFEAKKTELLNLFEHIELLKSNIEKNKINNIVTNEAELLKITSLEDSFKSETEFWQNSFNIRKIELLQSIEIMINKTIKDFAIQEEYDLIIYENVAFVSNKVNITEAIIDKIENQEL